jgi:hypothetical protein
MYVTQRTDYGQTSELIWTKKCDNMVEFDL